MTQRLSLGMKWLEYSLIARNSSVIIYENMSALIIRPMSITFKNTGSGTVVFASTAGGTLTFTTAPPAPSASATGGTVTTYSSGGTTYKVHTFTASGTFTVTGGTLTVDVLCVGGGGYGSNKQPTFAPYEGTGGGGGGEVVYTTSVSVTPQSYSITVGSGGIQGTSVDATVSSAFGIRAEAGFHGGIGGRFDYGGTSGSGRTGGQNSASTFTYGRGQGGGGDSQSGAGPSVYGNGGNGGDGTASSITGTVVYYGGGGGGGAVAQTGYTPGAGGQGGGGAGAAVGVPGTPGTPNTGGGGGGGQTNRLFSVNGAADGGSGVVIIRYAM